MISIPRGRGSVCAPSFAEFLPAAMENSVMPGETLNFQCWYRDLGNTNNFTDAVSVVFL